MTSGSGASVTCVWQTGQDNIPCHFPAKATAYVPGNHLWRVCGVHANVCARRGWRVFDNGDSSQEDR